MHFIDTASCPPSRAAVHETSPVDGSLVGAVAEGGQAEIDAAVKAATAALTGPWSKLTLPNVHMLYARWRMRSSGASMTSWMRRFTTPVNQIHRLSPGHFAGAANFRAFADAVKNAPSEFFEMTTPEDASLQLLTESAEGRRRRDMPVESAALVETWKDRTALPAATRSSSNLPRKLPRRRRSWVRSSSLSRAPGCLQRRAWLGCRGRPVNCSRAIQAWPHHFHAKPATGTAIMQAAAVGVRSVSSSSEVRIRVWYSLTEIWMQP